MQSDGTWQCGKANQSEAKSESPGRLLGKRQSPREGEAAQTDGVLLPSIRTIFTTAGAPVAPAEAGGTYWRRGRHEVCTGWSGSCAPMAFGNGHGGGRSPAIPRNDQRPPPRRMCSTDSFRPISRTAHESPSSLYLESRRMTLRSGCRHQRLMADTGVECSMSRSGNMWDTRQ